MSFKIYNNKYISTVKNIGTGTKIGDQQGDTVTLKTLKAGPNISITDNTTEITITASASATSTTTLSNDPLSVGETIITNGIGPNLTVKGFVGASGISIYTDSNNDIVILATGGGGIKGSITTTNNSYVTLISIPSEINTSYILDVIIVGSNTTNNNTNLFFIKGGYKNIGGTLTKISSFDDKMFENQDVNSDARLSISGTNMIIEVRGIAAHNINWTGEARIQLAFF